MLLMCKYNIQVQTSNAYFNLWHWPPNQLHTYTILSHYNPVTCLYGMYSVYTQRTVNNFKNNDIHMHFTQFCLLRVRYTYTIFRYLIISDIFIIMDLALLNQVFFLLKCNFYTLSYFRFQLL